jgi:hypothetical protein
LENLPFAACKVITHQIKDSKMRESMDPIELLAWLVIIGIALVGVLARIS